MFKERIKSLEYANSQEAWEGVNEYFLNNSEEIVNRGGGRYGPQLISYNVFIKIRKAWVDENFDFGNMFGYKRQKWVTLVNNYINLNHLDLLKSEVLNRIKKKVSNFNVSMPFDNSHGSGKGCLLALTVSKRVSVDYITFSFVLRSSEITKRLLWDLLLVQRIAEYILGKKEHISIEIFCTNMYQNTESFIMMDNHIKISEMLKPKLKKDTDINKYDIWQKRTIDTLKQFKEVDHKTVKFKVHLRSVRQLQRPNGIPLSGDRPLYAKDCLLVENDGIQYPEDCITLEQRKIYKKQYIRKQKRNGNN
jgi:hypothetical protein